MTNEELIAMFRNKGPIDDDTMDRLAKLGKMHDAACAAHNEIIRLRAELAETQAEMKPLAAHVQRDFEQVGEITRLRTRNEKLQAELAETHESLDAAARCVVSMTAELADCQRQAAAMRTAIGMVFATTEHVRMPTEICDALDRSRDGTAGRGFVPVEVAERLAASVLNILAVHQPDSHLCQCGPCLDGRAAISAYEAARGDGV